MDGTIALLTGMSLGAALGLAGAALAWRRRRIEHAACVARLEQERDDASRRAATEHDRANRFRTAWAQETRRRRRVELANVALQEQVKARDAAAATQRQLVHETRQDLTEAFSALGSRVLHSNSEQFLQMARQTLDAALREARGEAQQGREAMDAVVEPLRRTLAEQQEAVRRLEARRAGAYAGIEAQVRQMTSAQETLHRETGRLVRALRRPEQRGRWGELQLRNVCELAGMTPHCDFHEQPETDDPSTRDRPDLTVRLPGGGTIVVDSKVALDAYLDALEAEDDVTRRQHLDRHARQLRTHAERLARKRYWAQFDEAPRLVVMFVRVESAFVAAMDREPELLSGAMSRDVLITTPTLLVGLLRSIAYGWQQEELSRNAREMARVAGELHRRLATFLEHYGRVGASLTGAVEAFNASVGSWGRRVQPQFERLEALDVGSDSAPALEMLEVRVREFGGSGAEASGVSGGGMEG